MKKFMLLFRNNPDANKSLSPEQMQQLMKKWMDWRDKLEKNGHSQVAGDRLDWAGKVVRGKSKSVTDGPFVEVKDFVQGYMLLEAKDLDQALQLSLGCPALESDGSVEIRPFITA